MKKLILSMVAIAAISFTACSSDDDNNNSEDTCVTCAGHESQGVETPAFDVCKGENGNAFVSGIDTEVDYDSYIKPIRLITTCK